MSDEGGSLQRPTDGSTPESSADQVVKRVSPWAHALMAPFASLSYRDFRWLWIGQLGHASSMWAETVARSWLIWELTGSGLALGLVNLYRGIPLLVIGVWGGVAADRFDKRKLLLIAQTWSLLIYIVTAVLILGGWIQVWHVYITAAALGAGMAINQPVRSSFVPQLVGEKHLLNALSLNSIAINATRLIGAAAIGLLIAIAGIGPAYLVSAVLYLGVIVTTVMIRTSSQRLNGAARSMVQELIEGFGFLARNRLVLTLLILALGPLSFAFSYLTLLPIYATEVLHMGPAGFGILQSVGAIGALAGGLVLASRGDVRHKGWLMLGAGVAYGLAVMGLGGTGWVVLVFLLIVIAGGSQTVFRAANNSSIFQQTPRSLQGRIISLTLLETGIQPLASVMAGAVSDSAGISVAMVVIGVACVLIVGFIALVEPRIRHV